MNKLPIYNIKVGNNEGITKMSLVLHPAVESDFLAFSEHKKREMKFSIDEEKHNVLGVALRADYPIYRVFGDLECYVVFDKDTIDALYQKFMMEDRGGIVNLEHSEDTDGVHLIQSFIKDKELGINPTGWEDIEDGSWFVMYHISNEEVWEKIKSGEFKGFSVECTVDVNVNEDEKTEKEPSDINTLDELLNYIKN